MESGDENKLAGHESMFRRKRKGSGIDNEPENQTKKPRSNSPNEIDIGIEKPPDTNEINSVSGEERETNDELVFNEQKEAHDEQVSGEQKEAHAEPVSDEQKEAHAEPVYNEQKEAHSNEEKEAHSEPFFNEQKEAHAEPVSNEQKEAHDEPVSNEQKEAHAEPVSNEQKEAHDEQVSNEEKEAHAEPVSDEQKEAHDEPVSNEQKEAHDEPVSNEEKEAHAEPVSNEQKEAHAEPVSNEQKEAHSEPVSNEEKEAHSEPVFNEQKEIHAEPVSNEEKEAHAEPVSNEQKEAHPEPVYNEQKEAHVVYLPSTCSTEKSKEVGKYIPISRCNDIDISAGLYNPVSCNVNKHYRISDNQDTEDISVHQSAIEQFYETLQSNTNNENSGISHDNPHKDDKVVDEISVEQSCVTPQPGTSHGNCVIEKDEYAYRLLRPGEPFEEGLKPKNISSKITLQEHVDNGSSKGHASQFISCCKTLVGLRELGRITNNRKTARNVVRVNITKLNSRGVTVIDLTDENIRQRHIHRFSSAWGYAKRFEEVILQPQSHIPADCVEKIGIVLYRNFIKDEHIDL